MSEAPKDNAIFITGTDTAVGKTFVTTELIKALKNLGYKAGGFKAIECGGREDSEAILAAIDDPDLTIDEVNPLTFDAEVAPIASPEGEKIDFEMLTEAFENLRRKFDVVLVEGIGGWLAPLDPKRTMADFAKKLQLPVVLVAGNRLGVLNHSMLTLESMKSCDLECRHVIFNAVPGGYTEDVSKQTNRESLGRIYPELGIGTTFQGKWEELAREIFKL